MNIYSPSFLARRRLITISPINAETDNTGIRNGGKGGPETVEIKKTNKTKQVTQVHVNKSDHYKMKSLRRWIFAGRRRLCNYIPFSFQHSFVCQNNPQPLAVLRPFPHDILTLNKKSYIASSTCDCIGRILSLAFQVTKFYN